MDSLGTTRSFRVYADSGERPVSRYERGRNGSGEETLDFPLDIRHRRRLRTLIDKYKTARRSTLEGQGCQASCGVLAQQVPVVLLDH